VKHAPRLLIAFALALPQLARAQGTPQALDTLRISVASRLMPSAATAGRAVQVIDAEAIRRLPARSVSEVLAWATGVDMLARSAAQSDVSMRGATAEQVLVLVDGVRMSDRQTAHFALDLAVPLDQVDRVEILRGPASAVHGADAVGGVVNIVTRNGGEGGSARLAGGSFGEAAAAANVAGSLGAVRSDAGVEYRRADGARTGTDYRITQGRVRLATQLHDRPLTLDLGLAARDFGARAFYTSPTAPFDEYEETRTATAVLAYRAPVGTAIVLEPRISVRGHDDMFVLRREDPSFYRNDHRSWQTGAELVAHGAVAGARVAVGAEGYLDRLTSTNLGDREESRSALFSEVAFGGARANAILGLRVDAHSRYGSFVAPSLGVSFAAHPLLRLRTSTGRAFRAPSWTERYYVDPANNGNPDLDPERAFETEVGMDVGSDGGPRLSISAFMRTTEDLIDWIRPAGSPVDPWQAENVSTATFRGAELEARAIDPLETSWTFTASGLRLTSEGREGTESKYALRPITQSFQLAAERRLVRSLTLAVRAVQRRRASERSVNTGDARLQATFGRVRTYLDVLNVSDVQHPDVSGLPAPGRAFHTGVEWRW
jgi:vitamin B12 transporter